MWNFYGMKTRVRAKRKPRAATVDIIGPARRRPRIPSKWREYYQHLSELREHLLARQADLAKDALDQQPTFSTHMADAGTDTYDRDFALGVLSSEQDALYEIEEALNRIRTGRYGICEATSKPIEMARLKAIPWTRFTAAAEKQLERNGEVKRARLGPREPVARMEARESESEE
jgi:RNA polymerase-binding transcription factor DksA